MNIPNVLTVLRLALVPVFLFIFFSGISDALLISSLVFIVAGLTDVLDGYIARKYNMITKWGSVLDPLADKLMSLTVLISLSIEGLIPSWVFAIIGIKEIMMIIGGAILFRRGKYIPAKAYGKISTVLFYVSIIVLEFINRFIGLLLIYITVAIALYSLYKYMENFKKIRTQA